MPFSIWEYLALWPLSVIISRTIEWNTANSLEFSREFDLFYHNQLYLGLVNIIFNHHQIFTLLNKLFLMNTDNVYHFSLQSYINWMRYSMFLRLYYYIRWLHLFPIAQSKYVHLYIIRNHMLSWQLLYSMVLTSWY